MNLPLNNCYLIWTVLFIFLQINCVNSQHGYGATFAQYQFPTYYEPTGFRMGGVTSAPVLKQALSPALPPAATLTLTSGKLTDDETRQYQDQPESHFQDCHISDSDFDLCIKEALNDVRPFFKTGVPRMGIEPFDPFYAKEVVQTRTLDPMFSYRLKLLNVTESGWTQSQVTRFKSDFKNNYIKYTQFFPDKYVKGRYEFNGHLLNRKMDLKGTWELNLFDFIQTTTISRRPRTVEGHKYYDTPLRVNVNVQTCQEMELHVSNLLGGRRIMESVLDRIINFAWPPGFVLLRPLINDLVSTAFTEIFNRNFQEFDFHQFIQT